VCRVVTSHSLVVSSCVHLAVLVPAIYKKRQSTDVSLSVVVTIRNTQNNTNEWPNQLLGLMDKITVKTCTRSTGPSMGFSTTPNVINSPPLPVVLNWQESYRTKMIYKPSKVGQTGLVFGLLSELSNSSVHAGLQVYVSSSYVLWHPIKPTDTAQTDSYWPAVLLAQPTELKYNVSFLWG